MINLEILWKNISKRKIYWVLKLSNLDCNENVPVKFSFATNVNFVVGVGQTTYRQGKRKIKNNCVDLHLNLNSL